MAILLSPQRKHERRDSEVAYRKYKLLQTVKRGTLSTDLSSPLWKESLLAVKPEDEEENSHSSTDLNNSRVDLDEIFKKFISQLCKCNDSKHEHYHCRVECCSNAVLM